LISIWACRDIDLDVPRRSGSRAKICITRQFPPARANRPPAVIMDVVPFSLVATAVLQLFKRPPLGAGTKREPSMAKNHYVTKPKRRNKNSKRKDPSAATMAKLRQHAAAETAKPGR
jgi:hypothetical protein